MVSFRRTDFDDDDPSGFEAELAMLDEVEAEYRNDSEEMLVGDGPEAKVTSSKWSRPAVQHFDPMTESLIFQQLDVDSYTGELEFNEKLSGRNSFK